MSWLHDNPHIHSVRAVACDLNAQARGKRVPRRFAHKLEDEGTRFPFSVLNLDIWGEDIEDSPLVFDTGDADGILLPTDRGYVPMPWLETPTALLPLWMFHDDGRPFAGDPRHALNAVVARYTAKGLTPVVATELEFYLIDDSRRVLRVPPSPRSGKRRAGAETLAMRQLDAFDQFFTELYDACEAMDIPADTAISEAGLGQFEINMMHQPDALKAADDAWLFKLLVRGLARKHGFAASFMAKPYPDYAGNGLHTHFSVLDQAGKNIFDDGGPKGTATLRHAIAGLLAATPASMLIFAPHANSYDRLVPGAHAPTGLAWAYENRTAAIRVPSGPPVARRIEHRIAGGDINPYLMLAVVLGAALAGIEDANEPPAPITGNAYALDLPQTPETWAEAIARFERDPWIKRLLPEGLIQNLLLTKKQELTDVSELTDAERMDLYLDTV
ncbi:glutamine synthetase [Thalassobacter stenotrophicus]|uniref:glutamine synthetase family protein n=1 Tax=Thalassobacter TaxID=266808 RepID=UPI00051DAEA0|nr:MULTISPECIES: glutamine synthetase family protein [Thalassobacter]KGK80891.1 glutamine synthetase [Thalassobacter stenotrophicus]KGL02275.1 glutamine synthetase [Thalassobacter sp. 16PALIMAR09]